jgi:hypothetical protein
MSPRRPRAAGHSRQEIAQLLRDRRTQEETLILDVAGALERRNTAELAVAEAVEALTAALDELQRHGFEAQQVAELLGIDASELTGSGSLRRGSVRNSRPDRAASSPLPDDNTDVNSSF